MDEKTVRKQITFDLEVDKLKKYYPRPSSSFNPKYYKKAWGDIAKFMEKQGFEHSQYSIYVSKNLLTDADINYLIKRMVYKMPWLYQCLKAIDVTDIGEQYSLMNAFMLNEIEAENTEHLKDEKSGETMKSNDGKKHSKEH